MDDTKFERLNKLKKWYLYELYKKMAKQSISTFQLQNAISAISRAKDKYHHQLWN